jgi:hypothetical protein
VPVRFPPASRIRIYVIRARSLLAPRERLLPGLGARLRGRPKLLSMSLSAPRKVPRGRLRAAVFHNVSGPLISRHSIYLEVPVAGGSRMIVETGDLIGRVLAVSGVWEAPQDELLLAPEEARVADR